MIIDLSQPHPYREWNIAAETKVHHTDDKEYYQITYEKEQSLPERIAKVAVCFFLLIGSLGLVLFSEKFRNYWHRSYLERIQEKVLSSVSLENHLWRRIHACPSADALYWRAKGEHGSPIHLKLMTKGTFPEWVPKESKAFAQFGKSAVVIHLEDLKEDKILGALVFELTNFCQEKRFSALKLDPSITNVDRFAKESERIEYEGMKMHHRVIQEAIASNGWEPSMDDYGEALESEWRTFEGFWNERSHDEHANHYRKKWSDMHLRASGALGA